MITIGKRTLLAKTCTMCGVFKQAGEFSFIKQVYRDSYCKPCHNKHTTPRVREQQERALAAAEKHREPWCEAEVQTLREMFSEGRTAAQIASVLERSIYAVYTMNNKLKKEAS